MTVMYLTIQLIICFYSNREKVSILPFEIYDDFLEQRNNDTIEKRTYINIYREGVVACGRPLPMIESYCCGS